MAVTRRSIVDIVGSADRDDCGQRLVDHVFVGVQCPQRDQVMTIVELVSVDLEVPAQDQSAFGMVTERDPSDRQPPAVLDPLNEEADI